MSNLLRDSSFMSSQTKNNLLTIFILAFVSIFSAFVGLGLSYLNTVEKNFVPGRIQGWYSDGWIADTLNLNFSDLSNRGNKLILEFESQRTDKSGFAEFEQKVCGVPKSNFKITKQNLTIKTSISGECGPREMSLKGINKFKLNKFDHRVIAGKLKSLTVRSKLFFPIVSFASIILYALIVFCLSISISKLIFSPKLKSAILFVPLLSIPVFSQAYIKNWLNLTALGLSLLAILIGIIICKEHKDEGEGRSREEKAIWIYLLALAITLLGAGIRLYGLNFGLPGKYHTDETPKVNAIMRMIQSGSWNPKYFLHPSILLYSTYFFSKILTFVGLDSAFTPPGNFDSLLRFSGRLVSATGGILSVFLTFLIGKRLYTPFVGLMGALLLAVFPLHVTCSRYLKEDVLLTFWVLLVVYFAILTIDENSKKDLANKKSSFKEKLYVLLAFVFAGFSASTKYSGILSSVIVFAIPWLKTKSWKPDVKLLKIVSFLSPVVLLAFFIGTPYSVFDYPTFIKGFNSERDHMIRGHIIPITSWSQYWMYHLVRSIRPGISTVVTACSLIGVGIAVYRRKYQDLFLVGLLLLFYLPAEFVKAKPAPQPERYILPCLPFLALLAAEFVRVVANTKFRKLVPALCALLLLFPTIKTVQYAGEIYNDTREQMSAWMIEHIPLGSKVLVDWTPYSAFFYHNEFVLGTFPPGKMVIFLSRNRLKESGYDYLLLSSLSFDRYFKQPEAEPARRAIIRKTLNEFPTLKIIESKQGTYGFHNPKLVLLSLK